VSHRPLPPVIQPVEHGFWAAWTRFWFRPSSLLPLHALRVGFGLVALLWLLPLAGHVEAIFGLTGWFDAQAITEATGVPDSLIDRYSWSPIYFFGADATTLHAAFWGGVGVIVLFTLGLFTRITAVLSWLVVVSFTSNPLIESDADVFLRLLSFYLMVGYLLAGLLDPRRSLVSKLLAPFDHWLLAKHPAGQATPSSAATLAVRLIQVHFALAVVVMALHKLQFAEWWGGISFWYPLHRPSAIDVDALKQQAQSRMSYLSLLSLAAYAVLAWQLAFPFFAWKRGWPRLILLGGAVIGCLGAIAIYRQPLYGPVFFVLCLAYLTAQEWQRLLGLARGRRDKEE